MTSSIMTIIKKEFARCFKDRRMVFTTILMPGIMIYIIYSFLGLGLNSMKTSEEDFTPQVYVKNLPDTFMHSGENLLLMDFIEVTDETKVKEMLQNGDGEGNLLVIFPEDFEHNVAAYDVTTQKTAPQVEVYYNSTSMDSNTAYRMMIELLDQYETTMANKFDVNNQGEKYDLASEKDVTGQILSIMLPMLMMIFLFSGCMATAPESIAGEKERGTIATMLVTPMKRSHLALGKIVSLSVIAILSGFSSFLGTMLSLPNLMGSTEGMNAGVYGVNDYILLMAVILSTVLVMVSLVSIISAFAKTVKEATTWMTPLMMLVMLFGASSMMNGLKPTSVWMYLIPFYNSVQCMSGIFSFSVQTVNIVVTIFSNIVCTAVCVGVLTKMFNSEKVLFSK